METRTSLMIKEPSRFVSHRTLSMFPPWKAQVKLTDDPRTPVNLFPLKGESNCSPHSVQSKILHV